MLKTEIILSILLCAASVTVTAQLVVTVSPPEMIGQKAFVGLVMTNNLSEPVESARAVCFLMDDQGKMIGQATKWVIGGMKDRPALEPKAGATFEFVIPSPQPFLATNLTAHVTFARLVLEGGKIGNPKSDIQIQSK